MPKIILVFIIVIVAVGGFLVIARLITGEDVWLCVNGQWVKHGQPAAAKPTTRCGEENINQNNANGTSNSNQTVINSFEECLAAGFPVQESYPRKCEAAGQSFTEDIGNELEKLDEIKIAQPRPNEKIESPLTITGEARGTWYFEGIFSVKILDGDNKVIATTNASSQGEWMTEEFVAFKATLEFTAQAGEKGILILEKNNPSGLAEKADQLSVPLIF